MPDVTVRGVTLSAAARQTPKIIVPVMADTLPAAVEQAQALAALPAAELVELRLDPLPRADWAAALAAVRAALPGKPLLVTVRTAREGGCVDLDPAAYTQAVLGLLPGPDLIDVEFSAGAENVKALIAAAHTAGAAVVCSKHHFEGTPPQAAMTEALCAMADAGADIAKLAVMARTAADTAALLAATAEAAARRPDTPRLTMAMGPLGTVSRVCGGAFGSCATFGAAGAASAPGQPDAGALAQALAALQACL